MNFIKSTNLKLNADLNIDDSLNNLDKKLSESVLRMLCPDSEQINTP